MQRKCFVLGYKLWFWLSSLFPHPCSPAVRVCTLCLCWFTKTWGHWVLWGINKVSRLDVRMSHVTAQHEARLLFNCIFPSWAQIPLNWTFMLLPWCPIFRRMPCLSHSAFRSLGAPLLCWMLWLLHFSTAVQGSLPYPRNVTGFCALEDFAWSRSCLWNRRH